MIVAATILALARPPYSQIEAASILTSCSATSPVDTPAAASWKPRGPHRQRGLHPLRGRQISGEGPRLRCDGRSGDRYPDGLTSGPEGGVHRAHRARGTATTTSR
jgi:hypothetical protein